VNTSPSDNATQILRAWDAGDKDAPGKLIPLVYHELQRRAQDCLSRERADHTLQATALVHEAYLRLIDQTKVGWKDRAHFCAVAARVMRQILVQHARAHFAAKRGGRGQKIYLDETRELEQQQRPDLSALDDALQNLASSYPRQSEVVEMKFFGGLEAKDIAEVLHVSEKTVLRDWSFAKLWLCRELENAHA
jgi:RNA polymerase sigma factor (TIGR02999 family)